MGRGVYLLMGVLGLPGIHLSGRDMGPGIPYIQKGHGTRYNHPPTPVDRQTPLKTIVVGSN